MGRRKSLVSQKWFLWCAPQLSGAGTLFSRPEFPQGSPWEWVQSDGCWTAAVPSFLSSSGLTSSPLAVPATTDDWDILCLLIWQAVFRLSVSWVVKFCSSGFLYFSRTAKKKKHTLFDSANTPQRIYTTHFFFQFCDKTENERLFSAAKCVMTGNTLYVHYKGIKATVKYIMQQFFKKLGLKKKE